MLKSYQVPISVVCEITGVKEEKLLADYETLLRRYPTGEKDPFIPLDSLPLDVQDKYVATYLLHDVFVDLDPFALSGFQKCMEDRQNHFPIAKTPGFLKFANQISLLRQAKLIANSCSGTKTSTEELCRFAAESNISYRTLTRWRNAYMKNPMINRLLDYDHVYYQYDDHRTAICLYAVDYAVYRHIYGIKVSDNKILREFERMGDFPCNKCPYSPDYNGDKTDIPFICKRNRQTMLKPQNRYVLNRISAKISEQETLMCREGVRAWESEFHYTPTRKRPDKFGFLYITDHHLSDLFVITKVYADGSFDAKRVYITGVIDGATNCPVGYTLRTDAPNSSTVAEAFANAVGFTVDSPFHGLCRIWYSDHGKDYCSSLIEGNDSWHRTDWITPEESPEKYNPNVEFVESGILSWFGIRQVKALPFRGCSKKIERHWRTLEEEFLSDLPGYCGSDPKHRPAKFLRDIKKGNLYTFEQFANYFADTIWPRWCNFKSEPNSKSPMELFNEIPHETTITPSWRTLAVLKYKSETRKVQRTGIEFQKLWYWHPALASYIGETVHVFAFDSPFNRSIAVTTNHQYLCEAHPVHHLDTIEDQTWRVIQHLREQGRQRLDVTERLRKIEEIVLKSDILNLGLDIPAVQKITYAPAIDEERDESESCDDKRIPEELKAMAEKYAHAEDEYNSNPHDDDPMGDYLTAIGNHLLKKENGNV